MTRKPSSKPTEAELAILNVLWRSGAVPVRDVHEQLQSNDQATGYTTTLKLLQVMHGKGLVTRDESERAHIYTAAMPKEQVEFQMLGDLVSRLFGGSSQRLVMQALGQTPPTSREELDQIRAMLNQMERDL
jgi:BlaI family transcriptional regulator, penicillinase repressor